MARLKVLQLFALLCVVNLSHQAIPLSMLKKFSEVDAKSFINDLLMKKPAGEPELRPGEEDEEGEDLIFTKEGSIDPSGRDAVAGMLSVADGCLPKERSLQIPRHSDPNVVYWPTCTPVPQCGGCCGHEMLECAPTKASVKEVQVIKARYPHAGADRFIFEGMHTVELEQHHACQCRCRIQARHCHATKHVYDADSCRCVCKNSDQSAACPSHKKWDDYHCECRCPEVRHCMEGEVFSNDTCRCAPKPVDRPAPAFKVESDPCVGLACRVGYEPVARNGVCSCEVMTRPNTGPSVPDQGPVKPGGLPTGPGALPPPRLPLPPLPNHRPPPPRRYRRHRNP